MSTRCTTDNDYPNVPDLDPDLGTFHTCRFSGAWLQIVIGAIERLKRMCWENPDGTLTQDFGVWDSLLDMIATETTAGGDGLIVGEIKIMSCAVTDDRLLLMNGQQINRVDYPELFAAWGVTDDTMDLPGMSYRYIAGAFNNDSANVRKFFGANNYQLTPDQLPPHTHEMHGIAGGYMPDDRPGYVAVAYGSGGGTEIYYNQNVHTLENETQQHAVNNQPASYSALYYVVAKA